MVHLKRAHDELFRRTPDEQFPSFAALSAHCNEQRDQSTDRWELPQALQPAASSDFLQLGIGGDGAFLMNDWSFSQLCRLANVPKQTVNRLSPDTAKRLFHETLPMGDKPLQLLLRDRQVRSIHAASYTRLHNADLLDLVDEFASDFRPPQKAVTGGTGLYCGEQDMFCFLIDPAGWAEIDGQAFAPGFFIWNSEVGRRTVGIETFWFQSVCANHIVWDAIETAEFTRKHTTNVHEALSEIRRIIDSLIAKRDERRAGFVKVLQKAMRERLGDDVETATAELLKHGITRATAKKAMEIAQEQGRFTIFAIVDALTRMAGKVTNAGDRILLDRQAGQLLSLAA
jgi:histone H3/H4